MKLSTIASTAVVLLVASGCAQQQQLSESTTTTDETSTAQRKHSSLFVPFSTWKTTKQPAAGRGKSAPAAHTSEDIWPLLTSQLGFAHDVPDRKIAPQLEWLDGNQEYFDRTLARANLYMPYVLEQVLEAGLPAEVALLPFIESAYNPFAFSPSGAAGLWQFIPATGNEFGLHQTQGYEGRRDIVKSTGAAISYLQQLNTMFEGDWLLTFAAYNGGPGTVQRAIEANQRAGLATDFWSLSLSDETKRYVPRLVALSKVITQPDRFAIERLAIPNKPSFDIVELERPLDLAQAAKIAGISSEHLHQLNPEYTRWATPLHGPHRLLLPTEVSATFLDNLAKAPRTSWQPTAEYQIRKGDTLAQIARNHQVSVQELAALNQMGTGDLLRIGQKLRIPGAGAAAVASFGQPSPATYQVKPGDSLWSIARANQVAVEDLRSWNQLDGNSVLRPGQTLKLNKAKTTVASNNYQVVQGDSLYNIARRFNVNLQDLLAWNDLSTRAPIKPGQRLKIYSAN